jgi:hypothetical protein
MTRCLLASMLLVVWLLGGGAGGATPAVTAGCTLEAIPRDVPVHIPPAIRPRVRGAALVPATSTFHVTFDANYPANAQPAIVRAAELWSQHLVSSVPIALQVHWVAKGINSSNLATCGPTRFKTVGITTYPMALANKLVGTDLYPNEPDMDMTVNASRMDWYFGTDGQTPSQQYDLVTVAMHEIAHGLGIVTTCTIDNSGWGAWGMAVDELTLPTVYDWLLQNADGHFLLDTNLFPNPSQQLLQQYVNDELYFVGANATAANQGVTPRIYAPYPWAGGSSICHLHEDDFPAGTANALMTPAGNSAESNHNPGTVLRGMLQDLGWSITPMPDVRIFSFVASKTDLTAGQSFSLTIGVTNQGTVAAGPFNVGIYLHRAAAPSSIVPHDFYQAVPGLAPGASVTLKFPNLTYGSPGDYQIWAYADTADALPEPDKLNNVGGYLPIHMLATHRPDLLIRAFGDPANIGSGIYGVATGQTITQAKPANVKTCYYVLAKNRGNVAEKIVLTGPGTIAGWTVQYVDSATGDDITAAITGAGWLTGALAINGYKTLRVYLTAGAGALLNSSRAVTINGHSWTDPSQKDLVVATLKRVPIESVSIKASPAAAGITGQPVTLFAKTTGGAGVSYKFRLGTQHNGDWFWSDLTDFTAASSFVWTPAHAGSYRVLAQARESGSNADADVMSPNLSFSVADPLSALALTSVWKSPQPTGRTIMLTATPTGGLNLEYRFMVGTTVNRTTTWTTLQGYGSDSNCFWTPLTPNVYTVLVHARERGRSIAYERYKILTFVVKSPLTALTLAFTQSSTVLPATLTATPTGGATVEYRFSKGMLVDGVFTWVPVQNYASKRTYSWLAARGDQIKVEAREAFATFPTVTAYYVHGSTLH